MNKKISIVPIPSAPGNHYFIIYFYEFDYLDTSYKWNLYVHLNFVLLWTSLVFLSRDSVLDISLHISTCKSVSTFYCMSSEIPLPLLWLIFLPSTFRLTEKKNKERVFASLMVSFLPLFCIIGISKNILERVKSKHVSSVRTGIPNIGLKINYFNKENKNKLINMISKLKILFSLVNIMLKWIVGRYYCERERSLGELPYLSSKCGNFVSERGAKIINSW